MKHGVVQSILLLSFSLLGLSQHTQDWVWNYNRNNILPSDLIIPGRAEPTSPRPSLRVTTFHPTLVKDEVKEQKQKLDDIQIKVSKKGDSTTKSRVTKDYVSEVNKLDEERYTTLDKFFAERGHNGKKEYKVNPKHLGGLHPNEVFYADDNLLILKGGKYISNVPENKLQSLDSSDVSGTILPLPKPQQDQEIPKSLYDQEYNGNIPQIVFPTNGVRNGKSILWPNEASIKPKRSESTVTPKHLRYRQNTPRFQHHFTQRNNEYQQTRPTNLPSHQFRPVPVEVLRRQQQLHRTPASTTLISLKGDTRVNYLNPRPPVNPLAETLNRRNPGFELGPNTNPILNLHHVRNQSDKKPIL